MKKLILLILIILLIIFGCIVYYCWDYMKEGDINPVACSMDAKLCPDGSYVGRIAPDCKFAECPEVYKEHDLITLYNVFPNQEIESPLVIKGKAKGTWFFEGDFPIILTNWDGLIIAESYASAKGDWMTEDFVEFEGTIEFEKPDLYNRGSLILQKDNLSGLPENDDALEISITFK